MKVMVTGAAGFIANLVISRLLYLKYEVIAVDNLSRGKLENLDKFKSNRNFSFIKMDLSLKKHFDVYLDHIKENEICDVWHLAANSDIESGITNPNIDLNDTFLTTYYLLEFMKLKKIKNLYFSSSSAVYGDHGDSLLVEDKTITKPISNYGAMKLASESIIRSSCQSFLEKAIIFRFPNVIGVPATHGVIFDFFNKIKKNPRELIVLGDGNQNKTYLLVDNLVDSMFDTVINIKTQYFDIFNVGPKDTKGVTVKYIANKVASFFNPSPDIIYGTTPGGWIGDVPKFKFSIQKISSLSNGCNLTSKQAVDIAVSKIYDQIFSQQ